MKTGEKVLNKPKKLEMRESFYIKQLRVRKVAVRCLDIIKTREKNLIGIRRIQRLIVEKLAISPMKILQIVVNDTLIKGNLNI